MRALVVQEPYDKNRVDELGRWFREDRHAAVGTLEAVLRGHPWGAIDRLNSWERAGMLDELRWAIDEHLERMVEDAKAEAKRQDIERTRYVATRSGT